MQYQDRMLFGKDSCQPDEYPYFWRIFETADEYFDYYRDYHAFWKLYGLDLPDPVLRKLYYENALRIVPGLPAKAFPPAPRASPAVRAATERHGPCDSDEPRRPGNAATRVRLDR